MCEINPRDINNFSSDTLVTFVPMSAIDERTASIARSEIRPYAEVAKGYTPFRNGDVLFAKITPCMENGKCAIAKDMQNGQGFGSTEFHILRASEKIIPEWIYFFLRQDKVRKFAACNMTGTAGQQRVPRSIFDRLLIPLPPLPIQKKIAAILEKADTAREKRRKANELTEQFLQSAFLEMFGDPVTNPKGFPKMPLGSVAKLQGGFAFKSTDFVAEGVKLVKITNVHKDLLVWEDVDRLPDEYLKKYETFTLKRDDVVISMTRPIIKSLNSVKVVKIHSNDIPCLLNQRVGRFIPDKHQIIENYLLHFCYTEYFRTKVDSFCSTSLQPNISSDQVEEIQIPVPSLDVQQEFSTLVEKIELLRAKQRNSQQELDNLFNSLMQRAFNGKLVA